MKQLFFAVFLLFHISVFAQTSKEPVEVTPELQRKIKQDIERELPTLKRQLREEKANAVYSEFTIDTFRIERFMDKWADLDYSDFGMRDAGYAGAKFYDSLLNKYFKKLSAALKGEDKKALLQAQRAWILFRDNEMKLIEVISKDEYSGGGTMQQLTESSEYLNLVKVRAITLFEHYISATQNY